MDERDRWTAIHDHMPPEPKKLRVTGTIWLPRGGLEPHLEPGAPTFNPKVYVLELKVDEPDGGTEVETEYTVEHEVETETEYEAVAIRPDGPWQIEVAHPVTRGG